jgi:predicted nucleotide-binding protein
MFITYLAVFHPGIESVESPKDQLAMENMRKVSAPIVKEKSRSYISQADIPSCSLEKALKVPSAIGDNFGYKPSTPLHVAKALDQQPLSSGFRMLTGASIAYGLTIGGYNAESISITPLGMRVVRPTTESDDLLAKREAILRPRVIREFLQKYDGAPIPKDDIAQNVLMDFGVPQERTAEVLKLILEGSRAVGFLEEIKDRVYVDLKRTNVGNEKSDKNGNASPSDPPPDPPAAQAPNPKPAVAAPAIYDGRAKRVFITHGKNKGLIEPVKKLLTFGELEAVVSVQNQTVSQPVPAKVMEEMRSCGAAIIHVDDERHLVDTDGIEHVVLNDNVLIEIGAAMALYGQRFILIVKDGIKLPSNLQGLLELRYKGDTLDVSDTVNLMEAINDIKKRTLPQ